MRPTLFLALLAGVLVPAHCPKCQPSLPRIESLLVLDPVSTGGRSPVFTDPVELLLVQGSWRAPGPGDPVQAGEGPARSWRSIEP